MSFLLTRKSRKQHHFIFLLLTFLSLKGKIKERVYLRSLSYLCMRFPSGVVESVISPLGKAKPLRGEAPLRVRSTRRGLKSRLLSSQSPKKTLQKDFLPSQGPQGFDNPRGIAKNFFLLSNAPNSSIKPMANLQERYSTSNSPPPLTPQKSHFNTQLIFQSKMSWVLNWDFQGISIQHFTQQIFLCFAKIKAPRKAKENLLCELLTPPRGGFDSFSIFATISRFSGLKHFCSKSKRK
eukprot:TRINITY_DN559_c0_g1_i4.p1 TRINITY_DN559_c0_g1~~TRINITY_DN559_c0_g1_i4.p1  ORF type:complete len:237 (-),score=21.34 TRINITY_DN559_c0_g1_i4:198-908(-)